MWTNCLSNIVGRSRSRHDSFVLAKGILVEVLNGRYPFYVPYIHISDCYMPHSTFERA